MRKQLMTALTAFLVFGFVSAEDKCTHFPECWPEGSAMHTGLVLVQRQAAVEKRLEENHSELLMLVSSETQAEHSVAPDERLLGALTIQQAAWLKYRSEECELIGSLTGAGGTWPSTYANRCNLNHTEHRNRRVRSAIRCIKRLPRETRTFGQNRCLQQLAPLTKK